MRSACLATLAGCAALVACSGPDTSPEPPQHLYVGDDRLLSAVRVYTLPLSATSTPVVTLPMDKPFLLGATTNTLAITGSTGNVRLFVLPLTATSTAFAVINSPSNGTPAFSGGLLYQGGSSSINVFTPPFSNASVPSSSIPTPGVTPSYLAIGPGGTIFETTGTNTIGVVSGASFTIVTAAPDMAFRGLVATATRLFACGFSGAANDVFIYTLPLTESSTPAVTIDLGDAGPEACVLDATGNLYVGSPDGRILVFSPPFSSTSQPRLVLATPAFIFGMAVGS